MTLGMLDLTPTQRARALERLTLVNGRLVDAQVRATMNLVYQEFTAGHWIGSGAWPAQYTTIVGNAQANVAAQVAGYYAEYTSLASATEVGLVPIEQAAWGVTSESISAQAMPKRYGRLVNQGLPQFRALSTAGRYGAELSAGDMQFAQRAVGRRFSDWSQVKLSGFRKIPSGASCGWCTVTADKVYHTENVPFHQGCRCGVAPAVPGDGWSPGRLSGAEQDALLAEPSSEGARAIAAPTEQIGSVMAGDVLVDPFG